MWSVDKYYLDTLIENEVTDSVLKNKESAVLCKLDIEKAYDHMDWSFSISYVKDGFGEKWLEWITWCLSTASFSILVNGTPSRFFQSSRWLKLHLFFYP